MSLSIGAMRTIEFTYAFSMIVLVRVSAGRLSSSCHAHEYVNSDEAGKRKSPSQFEEYETCDDHRQIAESCNILTRIDSCFFEWTDTQAWKDMLVLAIGSRCNEVVHICCMVRDGQDGYPHLPNLARASYMDQIEEVCASWLDDGNEQFILDSQDSDGIRHWNDEVTVEIPSVSRCSTIMLGVNDEDEPAENYLLVSTKLGVQNLESWILARTGQHALATQLEDLLPQMTHAILNLNGLDTMIMRDTHNLSESEEELVMASPASCEFRPTRLADWELCKIMCDSTFKVPGRYLSVLIPTSEERMEQYFGEGDELSTYTSQGFADQEIITDGYLKQVDLKSRRMIRFAEHDLRCSTNGTFISPHSSAPVMGDSFYSDGSLSSADLSALGDYFD